MWTHKTSAYTLKSLYTFNLAMKAILAYPKRFGRASVRFLVYHWIDQIDLTEKQALYWLGVFKRWPAIFDESPYKRMVSVSDRITIEVGLSDFIERTLAVYGEWDRKVLNVLRQRLSAGSVFVDIGSNIGYFSLVASSLVGETGVVFALEPSLRPLKKLIANLDRNDIQNTILVSLACGSNKSIATLNRASHHNSGASSLLSHVGKGAKEKVIVLPIDSFFADLGIRADLIKIDVEGYEFEVLCGMRETLLRQRPEVLTEVSPHWLVESGCGVVDLYKMMDEIKYKAFNVDDDGSLTKLEYEDFAALEGQQEVLFLPDPMC